jgi:hypothetical protein
MHARVRPAHPWRSGIRPEHLPMATPARVAAARAGEADGAARRRIAAVPDDRTRLAAGTLRIEGHAPQQAGDPVTCGLPAEQCHLFDPPKGVSPRSVQLPT